jgi:hypothetical protein
MFDYLPYVKRFLQWVTLMRITMLGLGAIVFILTMTLFENRNILLELHNPLPRPTEHVLLKLSSDTQQQINRVIATNKTVNFIMVISANIEKNERALIYWKASDPIIHIEIEEYIKNNGLTAPLLGRDDETNTAIVRAINGDFACYNTASSLIGLSLNAKVTKVCRISIPPYYGQFSGYLTFGMNEEPSAEKMAELTKYAIEISSDIYFYNVRRFNMR